MWKEILGYEGLYSVNENGDILSHPKKYGKGISKEKILKPAISGHGYKSLVLCLNGKHKTWTIHSVVALTFIPNPNNKKIINHKNGIKTDNRVENLEWCTQSENMAHSYVVLGRIGAATGMFGGNHHTSKKVKQLSKDGCNVLCHYDSLTEASISTGVHLTSISSCCSKRVKTAGGFKWRYENE